MRTLMSHFGSASTGSVIEVESSSVGNKAELVKPLFGATTWLGRNGTTFRPNYVSYNKAGAFLSGEAVRRQEISAKAQAKFVEIAQSEYFESGYVTPSERYLKELVEEYPGIAGDAVQSLVLTHFKDSTVMVALLNAVGSMTYESVRPFGQVTALAAVGHPSVEVKEAAVRAYEMWGHVEGINILRTLDCPWPWLDDYRNQVIKDLGAT